jgi:hypothetical protein
MLLTQRYDEGVVVAMLYDEVGGGTTKANLVDI